MIRYRIGGNVFLDGTLIKLGGKVTTILCVAHSQHRVLIGCSDVRRTWENCLPGVSDGSGLAFWDYSTLIHVRYFETISSTV